MLQSNHKLANMTNKRKRISNFWKLNFLIIFLLSTFYFLLSTSVKAAEPLKLQVPFPCSPIAGGTCPTDAETAQSPAAYIARFYQFALMLAGMLAFGMIIFGAIQYIVSAGSPAAQSDARDRIFQALWGVALLLGAYLILYTIDPKLVSLTDPNITNIVVPAYEHEEAQPQTIEERKQIAEEVLPKLTIEELTARRERAGKSAEKYKGKIDEIRKKGPVDTLSELDKKLLKGYLNAYDIFEQEIKMIDQEVSKR